MQTRRRGGRRRRSREGTGMMMASEGGDTDHEVVHGTASAGTDTIATVRGRATSGGTMTGAMTGAIGAGTGHEAVTTSDETKVLSDLSDEGDARLRTSGRDHVQESHGGHARREVDPHIAPAKGGGTEACCAQNWKTLSTFELIASCGVRDS
jgi:hypothetical protein